MAKLPWIKFFPNDWLAEPSVRACSLAARGLWMDMLSLMHLSPRRGYLLAATGLPLSPEQLARTTGCSAEEVVALLGELRTSGCFSCTDDGTVFSRRMVREESKRERCSEAGKKGGGNPAFRSGDKNGTFKGASKGATKGGAKGATKPLEARGQTLDPPNPPPGGESVSDDDPPEEQVLGPSVAEVVAHWNSHPELPEAPPRMPARDRNLGTWAVHNPQWARHWRAVIDWLAGSEFHCGGGPNRWRADLNWLVAKAENFEGALSKALAGDPKPAKFVPKIHKPPATLSAGCAPTLAELRAMEAAEDERIKRAKAKGDAA